MAQRSSWVDNHHHKSAPAALCVFGSDAESLHGIQQHVINNMEFNKICNDHWNEHPKGCPNPECDLCADIRGEED